MRSPVLTTILLGILTGSLVPAVQAQRMQQRERDFLKTKPVVGEQLPDVTVYALDGSPFKTSDLRGHTTVLTFGCLT